ncbi:hypothetical protein [Comamonas flocculans]|uniref:DUF4142 domain-containing protein n=1 Tax=Comamonas flocculans TaxID=2597701 RepID=A0A5B8RX14_9BURK|nr:hypothetical protein [Comamonas flocculans]QEA13613.1 hypothetical protein FOZ74_11555 [Comamonas flocculans]
MKMKMQTLAIACAALLGLGFSVATPAIAQGHAHAATTQAAPAAPNLHKAMRSLWHGHVVTTRDYALAVFANDQAGAQKAGDAVVANAKDISAAVAGFYGQPAGDALLKLLAGHWGAVKALTDAAHAGNTAGEEKALNDAVANAGEISSFLAGANPNWKAEELNSGLVAHFGHHKSQVDLMAQKAPKDKQEAEWQAMQQHMDAIADVLADGIARQFPDKAN